MALAKGYKIDHTAIYSGLWPSDLSLIPIGDGPPLWQRSNSQAYLSLTLQFTSRHCDYF
jgi:hypothetical protein